jgi:hypothetical protein
LDQLCRKLPANPFDYQALTLEGLVQTDWPVIFSYPEVGPAVGGSPARKSRREPEVGIWEVARDSSRKLLLRN